jgi:hypothetical protein
MNRYLLSMRLGHERIYNRRTAMLYEYLSASCPVKFIPEPLTGDA